MTAHAIWYGGPLTVVSDASIPTGAAFGATSGTVVTRIGSIVLVSLRMSAVTWESTATYGLGALVFNGGKVFKSLKAENKENETSVAEWWEEVSSGTLFCLLPPEFRPAAEVSLEGAKVKTNGEVVVTSSPSTEEQAALGVWYAAEATP